MSLTCSAPPFSVPPKFLDPFCGNADFNSKLVDYVYRRGDDMLVVHRAPAIECDYCGERYYEADFEAIKDGTREAAKHLSVPVEDYSRLVG